MFVGVNISESWLGLSISGDPRRLAFWDSMLHTIKYRLSGWKSRFLSLGGRLTLLKFVLTSLSVCAISLFKTLSGINSSIESLLKKNCGGSEDYIKISWIN